MLWLVNNHTRENAEESTSVNRRQLTGICLAAYVKYLKTRTHGHAVDLEDVVVEPLAMKRSWIK